jgi:hypothetical protein
VSPLLVSYLIGRLIGSWFLVWLCCLLITRFSFQRSLRMSVGWKAWIATLALFVVALSVRLS